MQAVLRRRLERAVRVREFFRTHQTGGPTQDGAVQRLDQLVQRAETLSAQQRAGVLATRVASGERAKLRRRLQGTLVRYLAALGAAARRENTELAQQFRLPTFHAPHKAFVEIVKGMLAKATALKDTLISRGMSAQLLTDTAAVLAQFEQTLEATHAAQLDHTGATADLRGVLSEISQQVRVLDALVRYRYGDDGEVMGAWASASNVVGPFRPRKPTAPGNEAGGSSTPAAA
jgi:hypothetical protein